LAGVSPDAIAARAIDMMMKDPVIQARQFRQQINRGENGR
jgi:hypothetical protein